MEESSGLTLQAAFRFSVNLFKLLKIYREVAEVLVMEREAMLLEGAQRICSELEAGGAGPTMPGRQYTSDSRGIWGLDHERQLLFSGWVVQPDNTIYPHVENVHYQYLHDQGGARTDWEPDQCCVFSVTSATLPATEATFTEDTAYEVTVGRGPRGVSLLEMQKMYTILLRGGHSILRDIHPGYRRFHKKVWDCRHSFSTSLRPTPDELSHIELGYRSLTDEARQWAKACGADCDLEVRGAGRPEHPHDITQQIAIGLRGVKYGELIIDRHVTIRLQYIWRAYKASLSNNFFGPEVAYTPCPRIEFPTEPITDSSDHVRWGYEPEDETFLRGVKFRQGCGYLDHPNDEECPVAWAKVAVGLLKWAIDADLASFRRTVKKVREAASLGSDDKEKKVKTLLTGIGLSRDVVKCMMKRSSRMRGPHELPERLSNTIQNAAYYAF